MLKDFLKGVKNYFHFSSKEMRGFNVLSIFIVVIIFGPFLADHFISGSVLVDESNYAQLDSLVKILEDKNRKVRFEFDPNQVSEDSIKLLGISDFAIENWISYRKAGGKFFIKTDLKKIYGLAEENFSSLKSYIMLPDSLARYVDVKTKIEENDFELIDINAAKADDLLPVYGVGTKLSIRIIKYRDLLGGFVDQRQFDEVYHLSETASENLKKYTYIDSDFLPRKINLNEDEYATVVRHPYISKELTSAIFNARNSDSSKLNYDKIKKLVEDDSLYFNLLPYIEF